MRIIFVMRSVIGLEGLGRVMTEKANYLAGRGHEVMLVTYEQGRHPMGFTLKKEVAHIDLNSRYFTIYRHGLFYRWLAAWRIRRQFESALQKIICAYEPDVMVVPTNIAEYSNAIIKIGRQVPVVVESHTSYRYDMMIGGLYKRLKNMLHKQSFSHASLIVTLTHGDAVYWQKDCRNVVTIPNPLTFFPNPLPAMVKDPFRIISVGRLQRQKRFDRLIDAFAMIADKYPQWHVDIFGDGEEKAVLNMQIERCGLAGRVTLNAPVGDIAAEYMRSQFLVLSSDFEGFGLVMTEAMACALPVVATNCPYGPSDIVDDGQNGLLADLTAADLSSKMAAMMADRAMRESMGRKARQTAMRYNADVVMAQWESAYASQCRSRKADSGGTGGEEEAKE